MHYRRFTNTPEGKFNWLRGNVIHGGPDAALRVMNYWLLQPTWPQGLEYSSLEGEDSIKTWFIYVALKMEWY